MRQLKAFVLKEIKELIYTRKILVLLVIFFGFGLLNPFIAKMTPFIFEHMGDSLKDQGMVVQAVEVNAIASWSQFSKNFIMLLIVALIMFSGTITNEYQKGTLINMLTKGLPRWKVLVSKVFVQILTWSVCYWLTYGVTYFYTCYYWDNSITNHCLLMGFLMYAVGLWIISMLTLASTVFDSNVFVLLSSAAVFGLSYSLSMIPDLSKYLPTKLLSAGELLTGAASYSDFNYALIVLGVMSALFFILSFMFFNKKRV